MAGGSLHLIPGSHPETVRLYQGLRYRSLRYLSARLYLLLRNSESASGSEPIRATRPRGQHPGAENVSHPVDRESGPPSQIATIHELSDFQIVLVDPQIPANIGMVARAMRNCGFQRLVTVNGCSPRGREAFRPAVDAARLLEEAKTFSDLREAIADSRLVVGTTRRRGQGRHSLITPEVMVRELLPRARRQEVSILFGPERDGLSRDALDLCDALVNIPSHSDLASFNLAQAVLLVIYPIFRARVTSAAPAGGPDMASVRSREDFFAQLEEVLSRIGFLKENNPGRVLSALRQLLGRTGLEEREVRILRGILSQVQWAVTQAGDAERTKD